MVPGAVQMFCVIAGVTLFICLYQSLEQKEKKTIQTTEIKNIILIVIFIVQSVICSGFMLVTRSSLLLADRIL